MTYFAFLGYFILIPIAILLIVTYLDQRAQRPTPGFNGKLVWLGIVVHIVLAIVYTTPWDNYLVATGVWNYNPALVTGIVIGYVPLEEYTFFVLETILSGLWWCFLARRIGKVNQGIVPAGRESKKLVYLSTFLLSITWLFFTYQFFFGPDSWNYLGILFFWALPPIALQLFFGADILWQQRRLVFWTIFVPATYLSLIDIVALRATTWQISPTQTLGIDFLGILPLEEVAFFFVTNVLIGFGLTLALSEAGQQRLAVWKARKNNRQLA